MQRDLLAHLMNIWESKVAISTVNIQQDFIGTIAKEGVNMDEHIHIPFILCSALACSPRIWCSLTVIFLIRICCCLVGCAQNGG